jgi:hypothetical protein
VHGVWQAFYTAEILELGVKTFAFTQGISHSLTPLALAMFAAVILVVPYGILDAIAARLEGDVEHGLTVVLNILAPETQPVVAAVAAPVHDSSFDKSNTSAKAAPAEEQTIEQLTSEIEQEVGSEVADAVPDEEEII